MDKETAKKLKKIRAKETIHMTPETWIDGNGHIFFVDRCPIDFKLIGAVERGDFKGHK